MQRQDAETVKNSWIWNDMGGLDGLGATVRLFSFARWWQCSGRPCFFNPCFLAWIGCELPVFGSRNTMYDNFGRIFAAENVHYIIWKCGLANKWLLTFWNGGYSQVSGIRGFLAEIDATVTILNMHHICRRTSTKSLQEVLISSGLQQFLGLHFFDPFAPVMEAPFRQDHLFVVLRSRFLGWNNETLLRRRIGDHEEVLTIRKFCIKFGVSDPA